MICQQFEQLAHKIAHNELRDAKLLQDAHSHVETCAACNTLLIEARAIAATVASLAAHDKTITAPAHLESTLRTAFVREHSAGAPSPAVVGAGLRPARSATARPNVFVGATFKWAALSLAAAAIILVVALLPRMIHRNSGPDVAIQTASHSSSPAIASVKTSPVTTPTPSPEAPKHLSASYKPKKRLSEPEKTLTGFLALPYADDLSTVEYGAVVRMQMSRADLAWLGLPVPVSDSGQKIVADLFVNGSGTPEAIRLVR
jgi:hypothetical protein